MDATPLNNKRTRTISSNDAERISQEEQQPREKVVKRRKSVLVYDNNQDPVDSQLIARVASISDGELESDNLTNENNPEIRQQAKKMFDKEHSYSDCRESRAHSRSGGAERSANRQRRESDQHHRPFRRKRTIIGEDHNQDHLKHLINRK